MSKWEVKKLSDIGGGYIGLTYAPTDVSDEGTIVLRSGNIQDNKLNFTDVVMVNKQISEKLKVKDRDILICSRNGSSNLIGKSALITNLNVEMTFGAFMMIYRSDYNLFLIHYFHSPYFKRQLNKSATTTINQITKKMLDEIEVPFPPLETQKQIAKTLDTTAELLAMRKQQLTELDNLIKSTFYDMFGDPITNLMGWKTIVFSNCLDKIESGWSPKCEDRAAIEEEWGICKLSAVTGGYYKEIENKAIFKDTKIKTALEVKNGDLLFSRKNTIELVGSCAYVFESTKKLMIPDTVFRLCTKDNIHKLYLWGLLNCQTFKPLVQKLAGGTSGSMPNISKERLKGLKIPLPIFLKQTKFAKIVTKIEEQKALVKKAIDETQYLFDSLMSQYFE